MLETRVMPCLLVQNGRLVKTVKFRNPSYVGDPVNAIKIYNEKEVDELILLDITATIEGRPPSMELLRSVVNECFMPLTYGGGIRTMEEIRHLFGLGVEKVAINSYAIENPSFIREASRQFGSQSIVVSIDAKKTMFGKYVVHSHGGRRSTGLDPLSFSKHMEEMGAGEILLCSMDRDGTYDGYDTVLTKQVTQAVSIPVIACGGAGCLEDFAKAVRHGGASAVCAGSMAVYSKKGLGVLINFPARAELQKIL
jgi:cyclase